MERYCPFCGGFTASEVRECRETYPVRGEDIEVQAQVAYCLKCGEALFDEQLDGENLKRAYSIYRQKHGLLGPEDVKGLREKYGLTQRGLAALLGWSPATVNRYEKTGIPQSAHNHVLLSLRDPAKAKEIMEPRASLLSADERQRLEDALNGNLTRSLPGTVRGLLEGQGPTVWTGFRRTDLTRLAQMICFHTSDGGVFKTKLMKSLWYSDFLHFHRQSVSISGAVYVHLPNGPALENWGLILDTLEKEGLLETNFVEGDDWAGERIRGTLDFNSSFFKESELEAMLTVKREVGHLTSKQVSDRSHLETAWLKTQTGQRISYEYADELRILQA